MDKMTHKAMVVPVKLENHPNADALSIVHIGGWVVVVRTDDWIDKNIGVYIQPDTLVKNLGPFSFLFERSYSRYVILPDGGAQKFADGEYIRIAAHKFRGVQSFGLLVPAPEGFSVGDNAADYYELAHYEPASIGSTGGDNEKAPRCGFVPIFDVDAMKNYSDVFEDGELVSISEKIHGCLQADSLVKMADGSEKPIKDVKPGEFVISRLDDGSFGSQKVLRSIMQSPTTKLKWMELTFKNGRKLVCTEDHRILTDVGWIEAKDINETHNVCSH